MGGGEVRLQAEGLLDILGRQVVAAHLVGDDAEEVQGVGVARLALEDLAVEPLRLRQIAGAVVLQSLIQHVREG